MSEVLIFLACWQPGLRGLFLEEGIDPKGEVDLQEADGRLMGTVDMAVVGPDHKVAICQMHAELIKVEQAEHPVHGTIQGAADGRFKAHLREIRAWDGADKPWQTVTVAGEEYVLIMTPLCG